MDILKNKSKIEMKRFQLLLIICIGFISFTAFGQSRYFDERYIYTQSNIYPQLINPAVYGSKMKHNILVNYRRKWAGINDAPSTITMAYDGPVADRLGFCLLYTSRCV